MRHILLLFILFGSKTKSQNLESKKINFADSKPIAIKIIPNSVIELKYKSEIENECSKSALFAPKDEFESTDQYNLRKKEASLEKQKIINRYKFIYLDFLKNELTEKKEKLAELNKKIRESHTVEALKLNVEDLGTYDAENQQFNISINGQYYILKIPAIEAKSLKMHFPQATISTEKQLNEDGVSWDYFNFKIIHPTMGKSYLFNERKRL